MSNFNKILVSTTDTLDGLCVKTYLKPISAHVVAGTNFFSDFFASFSDVFGGRSATYQRQLSSIYSEAIEILKDTAKEIGANCILGLKVDLDEISGKGKSMFMITATGTAVVLETTIENTKMITDNKLSFISIDKMDTLRKKKEIIKLAIEKKFRNNDGYLVENLNKIFDFITVNSVHEIINEVMDNLLFADYYPQILPYLNSLDLDFTTNILFEKIMNNKDATKINLLFDLFKDLRIFDAERVIFYLQSDNELHKHRAIKLAINDKQSFSKEDIAMYEKIIQTIKSSFKEVVTYSTSKGLLSKEKEVWLCSCGNKNDIGADYCTNGYCLKDKYGFLKEEINPTKAIAKLEENIELIKENLLQ